MQNVVTFVLINVTVFPKTGQWKIPVRCLAWSRTACFRCGYLTVAEKYQVLSVRWNFHHHASFNKNPQPRLGLSTVFIATRACAHACERRSAYTYIRTSMPFGRTTGRTSSLNERRLWRLLRYGIRAPAEPDTTLPVSSPRRRCTPPVGTRLALVGGCDARLSVAGIAPRSERGNEVQTETRLVDRRRRRRLRAVSWWSLPWRHASHSDVRRSHLQTRSPVYRGMTSWWKVAATVYICEFNRNAAI